MSQDVKATIEACWALPPNQAAYKIAVAHAGATIEEIASAVAEAADERAKAIMAAVAALRR